MKVRTANELDDGTPPQDALLNSLMRTSGICWLPFAVRAISMPGFWNCARVTTLEWFW